jgi:hypothetical protein
MTDEFDIDIYGDLDEPSPAPAPPVKKEEETYQTVEKDGGTAMQQEQPAEVEEDTNMGSAAADGDNTASPTVKEEDATSQSKQKRKLDDRPYDPNATSALYIADLHWWTTDDDIRGWVNECGCEDELKDITFSEHKVNGKSKGYVMFVLNNGLTNSSLESHSWSSRVRKLQLQLKRRLRLVQTSPPIWASGTVLALPTPTQTPSALFRRMRLSETGLVSLLAEGAQATVPADILPDLLAVLLADRWVVHPQSAVEWE